jgi:glycerophosphoryl diester phosphodiesterase
MDNDMKTLIAHRGMSALAPENTLSAFSLCKANGISWFECDLDILKDGTVIISHDDTLDRCTDKTGSINILEQSALKNIDAGSWFSDAYIGEPIPTLKQLIMLINEQELNVNIEIKSCVASAELTHLLITNVIKELENLHPERELIVSSFNHLILSEFKRTRPETLIACLFESHHFYDDWRSIMEWCDAEFIHIEEKQLTRAMITNFKDAGFKVNVWTVNDLARGNELFNWGVDGIFTDIAHKFPSKYKNINKN